LYKTNQLKLKIYNTFIIKFYGSGDADYNRRCALASRTSHIMRFSKIPLSLEAKLPERKHRKAAEPLAKILSKKNAYNP